MPNHPANEPQRTVVIDDPALRTFEGGFTSIPNRILESTDLSLGARMAYAMLLKYAWQDGFCFPAQQSIARDLGVTDRSVRTFLKELRDQHLIDWKHQGLNRPNIYYLKRLPTRPRSATSRPGPEKISAPDRKEASGQERKQASDYEDPKTKTHNVDVSSLQRKEEPRLEMARASFSDARPRYTPTVAPQIDPGKVAYLAGVVADRLGDHKRVSLISFRRIVEALGEQAIFDLLGSVDEASRDGIIAGNKAAYFMGAAKHVARERGIDLSPHHAPIRQAA